MHERELEQIFVVLFLAAIVALGLYRRSWRPSNSACGTATWADEKMLQAAGMLGDHGLLLARTLTGKVIRLPLYTHTLLIGGTGSGKGVSVIVPQLLTYFRGSIICFDTKGDLFETTSAFREEMGERIIRLAPFNGGRDALNPLDLIRDGPMLIDQCRALAESLVIRQGTEPDPHWNESAVMVITALIAIVALQFKPENRNLSTVRDISADSELLDAAAGKLKELGGIPARLGSQITGLQEKEKAGVMSTVARHLAFLDSELVTPSISRSTFKPSELMEPGITLFIQIPPGQLEAARGLLRCWITTLIKTGGNGKDATGEVLCLLDEASALGGLSALEEGLVRGRSSGFRYLLAYQSDAQAESAFKDKKTLIFDNCSTHIYLGASGLETAEKISKRCGEFTQVIETVNENESTSRTPGEGMQQSSGSGRNWAIQGRPLLRPEEVLTLNGEYMIAFVQGFAPILAMRIKWFADPLFGTAGAQPDLPPPLWWVLMAACAIILVTLLNR